MVVTVGITVAELDEALDYLRVSRDVASAAGDIEQQLSCAEQIDDLLEHRHAMATDRHLLGTWVQS